MTASVLRPTSHAWGILIPVAVLCAIGLATIYATERRELNPQLNSPTIRQCAHLGVSLVVMAIAVAVPYQKIGRLAPVLYSLAILLLLALVADRWIDLPGIELRRHARRWIRLGPTQIQPAELAKIAYVLALAWYLRFRTDYRRLGGLIVPGLIWGVPTLLILRQPNLGTAMLLAPVLFGVLFVAGAKVRHLLLVLAVGVPAAPLAWFAIKPYQRLRIVNVLLQSEPLRERLLARPNIWLAIGTEDALRSEEARQDWLEKLRDWEDDSGYQLERSKIALGSGGVIGRGWQQGTFFTYRGCLPDNHNDFIFALIGHQWGLIGCLIVLACYVTIVLAGIEIATLTNDPFGRLLAVGLVILVAAQALTNVGMTLGLAPITGVTLPFVSYGGSSLISSFLAVGLLVNVAHRRPLLIAHDPFKFDEEQERARKGRRDIGT